MSHGKIRASQIAEQERDILTGGETPFPLYHRWPRIAIRGHFCGRLAGHDVGRARQALNSLFPDFISHRLRFPGERRVA